MLLEDVRVEYSARDQDNKEVKAAGSLQLQKQFPPAPNEISFRRLITITASGPISLQKSSYLPGILALFEIFGHFKTYDLRKLR